MPKEFGRYLQSNHYHKVVADWVKNPTVKDGASGYRLNVCTRRMIYL